MRQCAVPDTEGALTAGWPLPSWFLLLLFSVFMGSMPYHFQGFSI